MRWLIFLLGLTLLGLGSYSAMVTRDLAIETANRKHLEDAIKSQEITISELRKSYEEITTINRKISEQNIAQLKHLSEVINRYAKDENVLLQTKHVNNLKSNINKCIESISKSEYSDVCSEFLVSKDAHR